MLARPCGVATRIKVGDVRLVPVLLDLVSLLLIVPILFEVCLVVARPHYASHFTTRLLQNEAVENAVPAREV